MGWAARAKVRSGNPKIEVSTAGRVIDGQAKGYRQSVNKRGVAAGIRRVPPVLRGKSAVKAAKRRRMNLSGASR